MIQRIVLYSSLCVLLRISVAFSQNIPFTERQKWDGPYDIKMIAAPNLEAVFIDSANAVNSRLKKDSIIRHETIIRSWNLLSFNNRYNQGNPFNKIDIPVSALKCKGINTVCYEGLVPDKPNSTCTNLRFKDSPSIVKKYVSMTYADYDEDFKTYSSSKAVLEGIPPCSQVEAAYLYWTGNFYSPNASEKPDDDITLVPTGSYNGPGDVFKTSLTSGFDSVKLKIPNGQYKKIVADKIYSGERDYVCVANVTNIVKGAGLGDYWVGNIQSFPINNNGGSTSGWTLVIVSRSPLSPPRTISLWDGFLNVESGTPAIITLRNLQAPATSDFKSYVGFALLDGDNVASNGDPKDIDKDILGFSTSDSTVGEVRINPFATEPEYSYKRFDSRGRPINTSGGQNENSSCNIPLFDANWASVYDGISSSKISSYNEETKKNGAPIKRVPDNYNTQGYDSHHLLLPDGAVKPNATFASLIINAGYGSSKPFMAYLAIERTQPKLVISKAVDTSFTRTEDTINVKIRVINAGNDVSLGGDSVYDVLDEGVDFIPGSFLAKSFVNGVSKPALTDSVSLLSASNDSLQIKLVQKILPKDSIEINFKVRVKDFDNNKNLWLTQCKRNIPYVAYVVYNTKSTAKITNASNAFDCGPVSSANIQVIDRKFDVVPEFVGTFDATLFRDEKIDIHVQDVLVNKVKKISPQDFVNYKIYDSLFVPIGSNTFPLTGKTATYYAIKDNNGTGTCQTKFQLTFNFGALKIFIDTIRITNLCSGGYVSNSILGSGDFPAYAGRLVVLSKATKQPKNGTIDIDSVGNVYRYDPNPGFIGKDTIIIKVFETLKADTVDKPMYITVNPVNLPPVVKDEIFTTFRNQSISSFNILANDRDPNGDNIYLIPAIDDESYKTLFNAEFKKGDSLFFKNYSSPYVFGSNVYRGRKADFTNDSVVLKSYKTLVESIVVKPKRGTLTVNSKGEFTYEPKLDEGKDQPVKDTAVFWVCDLSKRSYCNPSFCQLNTVIFEIKPYAVFIPEGFSPNNDGINDFFVVDAEVPLKIQLTVFNRWGSLVYENKEYKNDWDGKANKGVVMGDGLPDGTYYVHVNVNEKEVEQFRYITISR